RGAIGASDSHRFARQHANLKRQWPTPNTLAKLEEPMLFDDAARNCWRRIIAESGRPDEEAAVAQIAQAIKNAALSEVLQLKWLMDSGKVIETLDEAKEAIGRIEEHLKSRFSTLNAQGGE